MPVQDFTLDANGMYRIQIHWTPEHATTTILLNGSILGTFTHPDEYISGKNFTLPDNSPLYIRFVNNYPQVFRLGVLLTPIASAEPDVSASTQRKRSVGLTAWLIINIIGMGLVTLLCFLAFIASMLDARIASLSLALLLLMLLNIGGIVGISLLLAWKRIGFYVLAGCAIINIIVVFYSGISSIRWVIFGPIIAVGILYRWLENSRVWDKLG